MEVVPESALSQTVVKLGHRVPRTGPPTRETKKRQGFLISSPPRASQRCSPRPCASIGGLEIPRGLVEPPLWAGTLVVGGFCAPRGLLLVFDSSCQRPAPRLVCPRSRCATIGAVNVGGAPLRSAEDPPCRSLSRSLAAGEAVCATANGEHRAASFRRGAEGWAVLSSLG